MARPPEKVRQTPGDGSAPPRKTDGKRKRLIRIAGAANDNVPGWAMRLGRLIVLGIVVALAVAGMVLALA